MRTGAVSGAATDLLADLFKADPPDVILNLTAFSARTDAGGSVLDGADVPVLQLIMSGAAGSVAFDFRGKFMVEGRFEPATMRMDVFSKDLDIIGDFARSVDSE